LEPIFKERATPFHQSVISIQDAFKFLKKEHNIPGRINDFADVLKKLGCERVGEIRHTRTNKHPIYWIVRNNNFSVTKNRINSK